MQVMSQMPIENELTVILVMKLADVLKERKNTILCGLGHACFMFLISKLLAKCCLFSQNYGKYLSSRKSCSNCLSL